MKIVRMNQKMTRDKIISLGLMSGTSVDGIDAVLVASDGRQDKMLLHCQYPYTKKLQKKILDLVAKPLSHLAEISALNVEIGHAFAEAAQKTILKSKLNTGEITVIGSHGQTVLHHPAAHASMQLGEPTVLAEKTG